MDFSKKRPVTRKAFPSWRHHESVDSSQNIVWDQILAIGFIEMSVAAAFMALASAEAADIGLTST